jgi:hypothetical protein
MCCWSYSSGCGLSNALLGPIPLLPKAHCKHGDSEQLSWVSLQMRPDPKTTPFLGLAVLCQLGQAHNEHLLPIEVHLKSSYMHNSGSQLRLEIKPDQDHVLRCIRVWTTSLLDLLDVVKRLTRDGGTMRPTTAGVCQLLLLDTKKLPGGDRHTYSPLVPRAQDARDGRAPCRRRHDIVSRLQKYA